MKLGRWNLLFMLVGLAGLGFMLTQVDLGKLWTQMSAAGLGVALAVAVHAAVICLDALVLVMCSAQPVTLRNVLAFARAAFAGHAINLATPFGNLGEITKFTLLADRVRPDEVAAALLVWNLLAFEANAVFLGVVGFLAPQAFEMTAPLRAGFYITAVLFVALGIGAPWLIRQSFAGWLLRLAGRLGLRASRVERARKFVAAMGDDVRRFTEDRRRAALAASLSMLSRLLGVLEVWCLVTALASHVPWTLPFLMLATSQVVTIMTSFVPFGMGTSEAGMYLLFRGLHLDPSIGIIVELMKKALRVIFIAFGVAILGIRALRGILKKNGF